MATGATEFVDATTADAYFPEVWSKHSIVAREQRTNMAALVTRKYQDGFKFGDTIHVLNVSNMTAQSKNRASNAAVTYETNTETAVDISIATWEYAAMAVETATDAASFKDQMALYAPKMGYALDLAIDDVLAGLIDDFSVGAIGTLAVPLTYTDILTGIQTLDDANVPDDERYIVASPKQIAYWMTLDEFIRSDYSAVHGAKGAPAGKYYTRSWLDIPVYKSTNVEGSNGAGHDNGMFNREALALVMQIEPKTHRMFDIDYLCDKVVVEHLYGTKEMRDDHGVWMKGY